MPDMVQTVPCPRCQHENKAKMGDIVVDEHGLSTIDEHGLARLLSGPQFTPEVLNQLKNLAGAAMTDPAAADAFAKQANALVPTLGDKLELYFKSRAETMKFLGLLFVAIGLVLNNFLKKEAKAPVINNYNYTYSASTLKKMNKPGLVGTTQPAKKSKTPKPTPKKRKGK